MKRNSYHKKPQRFSDCEDLIERVKKEGLKTGEYLFDYKLESIKKEFANMHENDLLKKMKLYFRSLPISLETQKALTKRNFIKLTEVQRCAIPHALMNRDVIVASKTGSGKTLSYLIPVIENLYRLKWTTFDQTGALILVPTRELAVQVFEVLSSLLKEFHELSYGLIVGGKSLEIEQRAIGQMNILICTPGRLLQHINETEYFSLDNLKMLVLDEADEILSLGFANTLTQILNAVPRNTQTMLFSATLSKNVMALSKIALNDPEQIFLQEKETGTGKSKNGDSVNTYEVPANLAQYAMVIPHEEKIDVLFSFIKTHKFSKIIVFVSCCKQVRFLYEAFKKLRIGLPMYELQARQKQAKRMAIYFTFTESRYGVLVSTNLAARGLDFPKVDWILQMDVPDGVETYVHRIGRTARFQEKGKSLVLIDPSERKFLAKLEDGGLKVPVISPNPARQLTIRKSLQVLCSENNDLKYLAQRAVISYVKCVDHMSDKSIFQVSKINLARVSESYGLVQTPVIKFEETDSEDENEVQPVTLPETGLQKDSDAQNLNRNQRKLLKFKDKLRSKKGLTEDISTDVKNINNQLNVTRETQLIKRVEMIIEKEDADKEQDFLVLKKKQPVIESVEDKYANDGTKVSKRQMKRIKESGVFDGRNVFEIGETGLIITKEDKVRKQLRDNLELVEKSGLDFADIYASKLTQNQDLDKNTELQRVKMQRLKKKEGVKLSKDGKRGIAKEEDQD